MDKKSTAELILHLNDVQVTPIDDGSIRIVCAGEVSSAGWVAAELRPQQLLGDNEMLTLDFVAVAPDNPTAQMIEEIRAEYIVFELDGLQGVAVRSRTNAMSVPLVAE